MSSRINPRPNKVPAGPCRAEGCKNLAFSTNDDRAWPYCVTHEVKHGHEWAWCGHELCSHWAAAKEEGSFCSVHGGEDYRKGGVCTRCYACLVSSRSKQKGGAR